MYRQSDNLGITEIKLGTLAKKQFTDNMDSLFGDTSFEGAKDELNLFPETKKDTKTVKNKKGSKGFSLQLDDFLADAFDVQEKEGSPVRHKKGRRKLASVSKKPRLSGLDLLIRQTADAPAASGLKAPDKRRLTLAFNKTQLNQLKKIAEDEGVFLKDLINQLIEKYLEQRDK